jgi:carboxymethylenebutenolidase
MKTIIWLLTTGLLLSGLPSNSAELQGKEIKYGPNLKYSGYFVRPSGAGPFPGLIVIHEWWGLNDYVKLAADRFAKNGYAVLAVDLFGKVATKPEDAMTLVRGLNQTEATARMLSAGDYLRSQSYVIADRVGSLGWCFGGAQSLQLALNDPKLVAAVIYYGQPVADPKELSKIHAVVLGIFGEADASIPMERVQEFDQALTKVGVTHEIHTYPGAKHAFASPTHGANYMPEAAADADRKAGAFLAKYLKTP